MKRFSDQDLENLLRETEAGAPPDGLLEAIQNEIPESVVGMRMLRNGTLLGSVAALLVIGLTAVLTRPWESGPPELTPVVEGVPSEGDTTAAGVDEVDEEPAVEATTEVVAVEAAEPEPLTVLGSVRDTTGGVLPGASVTLEGAGLGTMYTTSDERGRYRFPSVQEGEYELRAEMAGFEAAETRVVMTASSVTQTRHLRLALSGVAETVTVAGKTPVVELKSAMSASSVEHYDVPRPSTGGTHEPNDAAYDRVFFEHYGVNPFVDTEDDRLSTFAMDVDTGSYTVVRRFLRDGYFPEPDAVRVEEMVNFFDYGDEPPKKGEFAIRSELASSPFATTARTRLLRIGVRSRTVEPEERRPVVLTFLVDVSGSMDRGDRLELVKRGLSLLIDGLREDDRVGLVVFGSDAKVLQTPTRDLAALMRAINQLTSEGSTNMEQGLVLAYRMAEEHFAEGASNRVVLCSDGVANVGHTAWDSLLERVEEKASRGIELTALGFGMGNYNDELMEQLADHGDGRYAYIDTFREARRIFVHQIRSVLETVARDAKIQVEFDPELVESYRLLGYENRDVADEDFRNDDVDAGEVGAGLAVTALYELKLEKEKPRRGRLAVIRLRYLSMADGKVREESHVVDARAMKSSWEGATRAFRLSSIVAEFAEILRGSYWAKDGSLEDLFVRAQCLLPDFPGRTDVAEFVDLIGKAQDVTTDVDRTP